MHKPSPATTTQKEGFWWARAEMAAEVQQIR